MIRLLEADDFTKVQNIASASWHHTYEGIIPLSVQDHFLEGAYSTEMLKRRMESTLFLLHEKNGEINGFANFSQVDEKGSAELGAIYLLPAVQRQGIGEALLNEGLNRLASVQKLLVNVESDNQKGYDFYIKQGFVPVDEFEEIFYGHKLKTIRMSREIKNLQGSDLSGSGT